MENLIFHTTRMADLLDQIEQIINKRLNTLEPRKHDQSGYLTRKEATGVFKINFPTLHDWIKQGWPMSYKIGNQVLYKKDEVENSIREVNFYKHEKGGIK